MLDFIKNVIKSLKKPKPKIGELWRYKKVSKDPFLDLSTFIKIIDMKDGYVQYSYVYREGMCTLKWSATEKDIRSLYERIC